jgi:ATP-binding cassette subfamily F protein 3
MVSHDRHLLTTVIDNFYLVDAGAVTEFDGDLDDYAQWLASSRSTIENKVETLAKPPKPVATRPVAVKSLSGLRSRLARCEKRMQGLSVESTQLDAELAAPTLYEAGQRKRLEELTTQRARLAQETEQIETEWLELSEQLQAAASGA